MKFHGVNIDEDPQGYVLLGNFIGREFDGIPIKEAWNALKGIHGYSSSIGQGIRYYGNSHQNCAIHVRDVELFILKIKTYYTGKACPWKYVDPKKPK